MSKFQEQSRVSGRRPRRPVIYIICEGEGTEVIYFKRFRSRNSNVEIRPIISPQKSAYHLVTNARKLIAQENYYPEDGDQVWCVFDRNGNTNEDLERAEQTAKKQKFQIAYSNPAFEIWFLLHFVDQRASLKDADEAIRKLDSKNGIANYKKTGDYYSLLKDKQPIAIERASNLLAIHTVNGYAILSRDSNPGTTVGEFVRMLNERIENQYGVDNSAP